MKFLLSAFEPFGNSTINASMAAIRILESTIADAGYVTQMVLLPVVHREAGRILISHIEEFSPDVVICFGEAGGRAQISLEKVAVNLCDFRIADNLGNKLMDVPIREDGPVAYFATLPLRLIEQGLSARGIPVEVSLTAGGFLCNEVFYTLMDYLSITGSRAVAGFVHLPILPEAAAEKRVNLPSMSASVTSTAIRAILDIVQQSIDQI
ncbi:MAG: pyroglutamyl-peptidase I [Anaerolineae bacterium]|nr:pyroglutamyl-peptidase I [Anaerolineae bacterium]